MAFESRLASQLNDVEKIRDDVRRVDERLADLDSQLPVLVQSTVDVRFQEVERKLQRDFEEAQNRSMAAFAETLQSKVVDRISTLETNLAEQSQAIGKLRDSSQRSDENLQKMLAGIERLVDQTRTPPPAAAPPAVAPPVPVLAGRESPESVYQAASAIVRKEPVSAEVRDEARAPAVEVFAPPVTKVDAAVEAPPSVVSKPADLPQDTPVLAVVPEISPAEAEPKEFIYLKVSAAETPAPQPPIAPAPAEPAVESKVAPASSKPLPPAEPLKPEESYEWVNKIGLELLAPRPKSRIGWRIPLVIALATGLILIVGLIYEGILPHFFESSAVSQTSTLASAAPAPVEPAVQAAKPPENLVELDVAREYQRRKDWTKAESSFRRILESNPNNRDAAIGLSDVLYQEQKYEESAAVLNKLRSAKSQ